MTIEPLYALAGLVFIGVGAQWLANRFRVPAIVLLLATGLLLGPVAGLLRPDALFGDLLGAFVPLAVAVILFEGGLSLRLREAQRLGATLWSLVGLGLVVSFAATTWIGMQFAGLSWATAACIGGILVVTGPTVIKPMLRQARLPSRPANLLKWEGIVNDPFGALIAVLVLQFALLEPESQHRGSYQSLILALIGWSVAAVAFGAGIGWAFGRALQRGWIPEHLKSLTSLALVLGVFASCDAVYHESGLLGVTAMGIVLANLGVASVEDVRRFKEEVTTLLVAVLFLVLAARLELSALEALAGAPLLLIVAVVFVVRPLAVGIATARSPLPWQERALLAWIAPRGVVAAAVAGAFAPELERAGVADANLLVPIIFGVILSTVVLHGLSIRPLARRLGLASERPGGLLIVGAVPWTLDLARALEEAGVEVAITDNRHSRATRGRLQGHEVIYGDALDEETQDELPMERLGWVLAATVSDSFNALVCVNFTPLMGRDRVLQLTPGSGGEGHKEGESHLRGQIPWGERGSYAGISRLHWGGARFKVTRLTEEYRFQQWWEENREGVPLFAVQEGALSVVKEGEDPGGERQLVYLPATPSNGD